jgi:excinuclease ABC subunit A
LHFADVEKLLGVINGLVDKGNTVIVIEHNLDVIKTADHVIDMGPEGGSGGGLVIAEGTPEEIARNPDSYTGQFLGPVLAGRGNVAGQRSARNGAATAERTAPVKAIPVKGQAPKGTAPKGATSARTPVGTAGASTPRSTRTSAVAKTESGKANAVNAANGSAPANGSPTKNGTARNGTTTIASPAAAAIKARRRAAKLV